MMETRALRMYGAKDLRVEEFELPEITDDEILVKVISDSVCMSTYKCAILGSRHKRVPENVATHPVIMGHEFAGEIVQVGKNHRIKFAPGMKFALQPALNYKGTMWSPGYSYEYFGGNATYTIIPPEVMELGCLLEYNGDSFFEASLAEPISCSIGAFHSCYHTIANTYDHVMGTKQRGKLALLAGGGPMGLGAVDYALNCDNPPSLLVVTDLDASRIERLGKLFPKEKYAARGIQVVFLQTGKDGDAVKQLMELSPEGYDDVFVYAPVQGLVRVASDILGRDGCMNFFAGPTDPGFSGQVNLYDVHYNRTHVLGSTGGNLEDMKEALRLTQEKRIHPAIMITHVGGLNSAAETVLHLPEMSGGKKLIYNQIDMELTALEDLREKGKTDKRFADLADIVDHHDGLWNKEAEDYLLNHWK